MKSPRLKILVTALCLATCAHLQARFVTLTVNGNPNVGPTNLFAQLTIQSNEVATVRYMTATPTIGSVLAAPLNVIKDGIPFWPSVTIGVGTVIAGPAVFQATSYNGAIGFYTIEISPESFPPDKTLIIPAGTGANITFECSTNLLDWNAVWQGTYTNAPSNKFFRIRADRLP
jgi:hypothetical protein